MKSRIHIEWYVLSFIFLILVLSLILGPNLTGFATYSPSDNEETYPLDQNFTSREEVYTIPLDIGLPIESLRLNGEIVESGNVTIILSDGENEWILYNYEEKKSSGNLITGKVTGELDGDDIENVYENITQEENETLTVEAETTEPGIIEEVEVNETQEENLTVEFNETEDVNLTIVENVTLEVNDTLDENITSDINETIDENITIDVNEAINETTLVNETETTSSQESFDEEDEDEEEGTPDEEVVINDTLEENLTVEVNESEEVNDTEEIIILDKTKKIKTYCLDTCTLPQVEPLELKIKVSGEAQLYIESLLYTPVIVARQIEDIPDQTILLGEEIQINLTEYFVGEDLYFDIPSDTEVYMALDDDVLTIRSDLPGSFDVFVYALIDDELIRSNEFGVSVVEEIIEEIIEEVNETYENNETYEELILEKNVETMIPISLVEIDSMTVLDVSDKSGQGEILGVDGIIYGMGGIRSPKEYGWNIVKTGAEEYLDINYELINDTATEFCIDLNTINNYLSALPPSQRNKEINMLMLDDKGQTTKLIKKGIKNNKKKKRDESCFILTYEEYTEGIGFKLGEESVVVFSNGVLGQSKIVNSMTKHVFYDQINDRWHIVILDNGDDIHTVSSTDGDTWDNGADIATGTYDYEDFDCIINHDFAGEPPTTYLHCVYSTGDDENLYYKRSTLDSSGDYITVGNLENIFASSSFGGGSSSDDASNPRIIISPSDCLSVAFNLEDVSELGGDRHEVVVIAENTSACGDGDWDIADMQSSFPKYSVQSDQTGYTYDVPLGFFSFPDGTSDGQLLWVDTDSSSDTDLETIFFNGTSGNFGTQDTLDTDIEWSDLFGSGYTSVAGVTKSDGSFMAFAMDDGTQDLDAWTLSSKGSVIASVTDTTLNMYDSSQREATVTAALDYEAATETVYVFAVDSIDTKDIRVGEYDTSWSASDWENDVADDTNEIFHLSSWFDNETCDVMVLWVNGSSTSVAIQVETYTATACSSSCLSADDCDKEEVCIAGTCRADCNDTYDGLGCSNDSNSYLNSASGMCARNNAGTWSCAKLEVAVYSGDNYSDCYEPYAGEPTSAITCDIDVAPGYTATGVCTYQTGTASTATVDCDALEVCVDGSGYYRSDCSNCGSTTENDCDSGGGTTYSADGVCVSDNTACDVDEVCFDDTNFRSDCSNCSSADTDVDACDSNVVSGNYVAEGYCTTGGVCSTGSVYNDGGTLTDGCTDGGGEQCDSDATGSESGSWSDDATGVCVSGSTCDDGDVYYDDEGATYYGSAQSSQYDYDLDSTGDGCDDDASGGYSRVGMTVYTGGDLTNNCDAFGGVVSINSSNGNFYQTECHVTNEYCDSSTSDSDDPWLRDGTCVTTNCCSSTEGEVAYGDSKIDTTPNNYCSATPTLGRTCDNDPSDGITYQGLTTTTDNCCTGNTYFALGTGGPTDTTPYDDCSETCTMGNTCYDIGVYASGFADSEFGICIEGNYCDYDQVCYSSSTYYGGMHLCNEGDACDSDVDPSGYIADGIVFTNEATNVCCDGTEDYNDTSGGSNCCYNGALMSEGDTFGTGSSLICSDGGFYDCGDNGGSTSPDANYAVTSGSCTTYEGLYCIGTTWGTVIPDDCSGCTTGDNCSSGVCIEGTCRSACSVSYDGDSCSNDGTAYDNSASGSCARNNAGTWSCDKDEQALSTNYYTDCYEVAGGAPTGSYTCDSDVAPNFVATGICSYSTGAVASGTVNCDADEVCYDDTNYRSDCDYCSVADTDVDACDSDGGTTYNADGYCVTGGTCETGSVYSNAGTLTSGCTDGTTEVLCDSNADGSETGSWSDDVDGICVSGNSCATGIVFFDDEAPLYSTSIADVDFRYTTEANGDSCDSDINNSGYIREGQAIFGIGTAGTNCQGFGDIVSVHSNNIFYGNCDTTDDQCDSSIADSDDPYLRDGTCVSTNCCSSTEGEVAFGDSLTDTDPDNSCSATPTVGRTCDDDPSDGINLEGLTTTADDCCTGSSYFALGTGGATDTTPYDGCSTTCTNGNTCYDIGNVASGFADSEFGLCVSGNVCETEDVCYSSSIYYNTLGSCSEGDACDSDVDTSGYFADGIVFINDGSELCCDGTEDYNDTGGSNCCYNGVLLSDGTSSSSMVCEGGGLYDCGSQVATTSPDTHTNDVDCQQRGSLYCDTDTNTWISSLPLGCSGCSSASDCESGICISGTCRAACDAAYDGENCSDNSDAYTAHGICTLQTGTGWTCDTTESAYDDSDYLYACSDSAASYGEQCDSNSLSGGYSVDGVCGGTSHGTCYTDYASDESSGITASTIFGTQAESCAIGYNGDYCDDVSDGSFVPGDKRCDGSDTTCRVCTLSTGEDAEGFCESGCGADASADELSADACDGTSAYVNSTCSYNNVADELNSACACLMTGTTTFTNYWNIGGESNSTICCENTTGEYAEYEDYATNLDPAPSENDDACCSNNTDCVDDNVCRADTYASTDVDGDGDNDYCNAGQWIDCNTDSECGVGYYCNLGDCAASGVTVTYASPTPTDNARLIDNSVTINVTVTSTGSNVVACLLEWQGSNESMNVVGSGTSVSCNSDKVTSDATTYIYKVYANNTVGSYGNESERDFRENDEPTLSTTTLTASSSENLTSDNLTLTTSGNTDADSDTVLNITDWRLDGTSIAVLNMPFDTNVTSTTSGAVNDYSTYDYDGTIASSDDGPTWIADGIVGGAYEFDGTAGCSTSCSSYDVITTSSFQLGSDVSVCFWVKPKLSETKEMVVHGTASTGAFEVYQSGTDVSLRGGDSTPVLTGSSALTIDSWSHICAVISGTTGTIYSNASLVNSGSVATPESAARQLGVGGYIADGDYAFNGTIDQVMVFNKSLTINQIQELFDAGVAGGHLTELVSNETNPTESWTVQVTPNDAWEDGSPVTSNAVVIENRIPSLPSVLTPLNGNFNSTVSINCSGSTDLDGQTVYYDIQSNHTGSWTDLVTDDDGEYDWDISGLELTSSDLRCRADDLLETSDWYNPPGTLNVDTIRPVNISKAYYPAAVSNGDTLYLNVTFTDGNLDTCILEFYNGSSWFNITNSSCTNGETWTAPVVITASEDDVINWTWYGLDIFSHTNKTDYTSLTVDNEGPSSPTSLTPESGTYNETVSLVCSGSSDPDGDPFNYTIETNRMGTWTVVIANDTDGSYSWDISTYENDNVDMRCKATNTLSSDYYSSSGTLILDSLAPRLSSNTSDGSGAPNQNVTFSATFDDVTLDTCIFEFYNGNSWSNTTNSSCSSGNAWDVIKEVDAVGGMIINWSWWANDTQNQMFHSAYTSYTIVDNLSMLVSQINPTTAYDEDDLLGYCTGYDFGGANIDYYYEFYVDGLLNESGSTSGTYASETEVNVLNISEGVTLRAQDWVLSCLVTNSTHNSSWLNSSTKTIQNHIPTLDLAYLNSTSANNLSSDNLTLYTENNTDSDASDTVVNITDWRIDGTSIAVLNMPFDTNISDDTTDAVKDYSTYGNDGTLASATSQPTWISTGQIGGAYSFDGGDYVEVAHSDSLSFTGGSPDQPFTIETWVYPNDASTFRIISKGVASSNGEYFFTFDAGDALLFRVFDQSTGGTVGLKSSSALTDLEGDWHHVVVTYDGGASDTGLKLYVNGSSISTTSANTGSYTAMEPTSHNLHIGRFSTSYANGYIDGVKIYDKVLTEDQINNLYQAGLANHDVQVIVSNETSSGELWTVAVTPNDGWDDGSTTISNTLVVENAAPTTPTVMTPTSGYYNSTFTLNCTGSTDPDGDDVYYTIETNWTGTWTEVVANDSDGEYDWDVGYVEGLNIDLRCYATDLSDSSSSFNPVGTINIDGRGPQYTVDDYNASEVEVSQNDVIEFNVTFVDNNLDTCTFEYYNGTHWTYEYNTTCTSGENWTIIKTIYVASGVINWSWYANDTNGQQNQTDYNFFTLGSVAPVIDFENLFINYTDEHSFDVVAGITHASGGNSIKNTTLSYDTGTCSYSTNASYGTRFNVTYKCSGTPFTSNTVDINFCDFDGDCVSSSESANIYPNQIPVLGNLLTPTNGNETIHDLTPLMTWSAGSDADGDDINYTINISFAGVCDATVFGIEENTTALNYTHTEELCPDALNNYSWTLKICDAWNCSDWYTTWTFLIEPFVDINFVTTDTVSFGSMTVSTTNSTDSVGGPTPFHIRNDGNVYANLFNISSITPIWVSSYAGFGTNYMRIKARDDSEAGSFNTSKSDMSWVNYGNTTHDLIYSLNYSDSTDQAYIDVDLTVPSQEPPGAISHDMIFSWEQDLG